VVAQYWVKYQYLTFIRDITKDISSLTYIFLCHLCACMNLDMSPVMFVFNIFLKMRTLLNQLQGLCHISEAAKVLKPLQVCLKTLEAKLHYTWSLLKA
jgi:hypothetical protein